MKKMEEFVSKEIYLPKEGFTSAFQNSTKNLIDNNVKRNENII